MNYSFFDEFLNKTQFPAPACEFFTKLVNEIGAEMDPILTFYEAAYDHDGTVPLVEDLAKKTGHSAYSIWMLLLILAAEKARPLYRSEEYFWNTFCDLRYKAQECYDVHGIWGTFVARWYPIFYNGTIVKLGRMEYQLRPCPIKEPQTVMGITVHPGDPVIFLHIPTSFEPFDKAARLESYKQAWAYFCPDGSPLVCLCASWLLYDGYEDVFAPGSNIASFRKDFHMLSSKPTDDFGNAWRVFGKDHKLPPEQLPENTSLQRAFKAHYLKGGTHGNGTGVIVFDGEKLLSER